MGKMTAIVLATNIPGHLADFGKLSDIQEFVRAPTMVMMFICEACLSIGGEVQLKRV